jgi:UDP:flavonoid glycosyltransferase YjiC (YdhE family)
MRVLFVAPSSHAHINPMVPLAGAFQGAGHEVRLATHPEMTEVVRNLGLSAVAVGERDFPKANAKGSDDLYHRVLDIIAPDVAEGAAKGTGRPPSNLVIRALDRYYNVDPPGAQGNLMADDLVAFARGWRPDLILWDSICFPAAIAARVTGAAHARVLWSIDDVAWTRAKLLDRLRSSAGPDPMAETMAPMLRRFGLEFGEDLLLGQWTVDQFPAPRLRLQTDLRYVHSRLVAYNGSTVVPEWLYTTNPERPRVAVSLGAGIRSFFPDGTSKVGVEELFEISAELGIELVATLNKQQLRAVRTVPDNVRVVDYLPLDVLLPTCSALIHHGGSGTFATAVHNKLPHLVWTENGPYYVDIAKVVEESGAGLVIDDAAFDRDTVKKQLMRVLSDPELKQGATALYRDLLAVPSPAEAVPVLEKLTEEHRSAALGSPR